MVDKMFGEFGCHIEGEDTPDQMKRARSSAKDQITKVKDEIKSLMHDPQNAGLVRTKCEHLADSVFKLKDVSARYISTLIDGDAMNDARGYEADMLNDVNEFKKAVMNWLLGEKKDKIHVEEAQHGAYGQSKELNSTDRLHAIEQMKEKNETKLNEIIDSWEVERRQFQQQLAEEERKQCKERQRFRDQHAKLNEELQKLMNEEKLSSLDRNAQSFQENDKGDEMTIKAMISEILKASATQQQTMIDSLQLPKKELQHFDGDPLNYWTFIQSFRTSVGNKNVDDSAKLSCLLHYCTGVARKVLRCTEMMSPSDGYKRALEILESRFGDPYDITQRWVSRITDRQNISCIADLRDFADELQCCKEMLQNMGQISHMDNPHSLKMIWQKLPPHLQDRWLRQNLKIKRRKQGMAKLSDLTEFIVDSAEELLDPVFSPLSSRQQNVPTGIRTYYTRATPYENITPRYTKRKCFCCRKRHFITQCEIFGSMSVNERRNMVMAKGLCRNCLCKGHISKDCLKDFTCGIDGCTLKHSKFLHWPVEYDRNLNEMHVPERDVITDARSVSKPARLVNHHESSQYVKPKRKFAMPIVPARVWKPGTSTYVDTYALLDTGSNVSYCTEDLCDQLGVQGRPGYMEITTLINTRKPLRVLEAPLEITSMACNERYYVDMTIQPALNIDQSCLSSQIDIQQWSHLKDLPIANFVSENAPVQLLIGQNASDLLIPGDVRKGSNGEPFAVHTPLGWAINGPISLPRDSSQSMWNRDNELEVEHASNKLEGYGNTDSESDSPIETIQSQTIANIKAGQDGDLDTFVELNNINIMNANKDAEINAKILGEHTATAAEKPNSDATQDTDTESSKVATRPNKVEATSFGGATQVAVMLNRSNSTLTTGVTRVAASSTPKRHVGKALTTTTERAGCSSRGAGRPTQISCSPNVVATPDKGPSATNRGAARVIIQAKQGGGTPQRIAAATSSESMPKHCAGIDPVPQNRGSAARVGTAPRGTAPRGTTPRGTAPTRDTAPTDTTRHKMQYKKIKNQEVIQRQLKKSFQYYQEDLLWRQHEVLRPLQG